jgi:hypothetical protein
MRKSLAAILVILLSATARLHAGAVRPLPPLPVTATAPETRATDIPAANPYAREPGGGCCNCPRTGSCWHRLLGWATYCPKERIGCCHGECNVCHYKGEVPVYLFFLNPCCVEGSGIHPTAPPFPCPSKGATHCRHCSSCAKGPCRTCAACPSSGCVDCSGCAKGPCRTCAPCPSSGCVARPAGTCK